MSLIVINENPWIYGNYYYNLSTYANFFQELNNN